MTWLTSSVLCGCYRRRLFTGRPGQLVKVRYRCKCGMDVKVDHTFPGVN